MAQTKSEVLDELTSQVNKDELVEIVGSKRLERRARLGASTSRDARAGELRRRGAVHGGALHDRIDELTEEIAQPAA